MTLPPDSPKDRLWDQMIIFNLNLLPGPICWVTAQTAALRSWADSKGTEQAFLGRRTLRADSRCKKLVIFAPSFNSVQSFGNQTLPLAGDPLSCETPCTFPARGNFTNVKCYTKATREIRGSCATWEVWSLNREPKIVRHSGREIKAEKGDKVKREITVSSRKTQV